MELKIQLEFSHPLDSSPQRKSLPKLFVLYLTHLGYKGMAQNSRNIELTSMYSRMPFAGAATYLNSGMYRCKQ